MFTGTKKIKNNVLILIKSTKKNEELEDGNFVSLRVPNGHLKYIEGELLSFLLPWL